MPNVGPVTIVGNKCDGSVIGAMRPTAASRNDVLQPCDKTSEDGRRKGGGLTNDELAKNAD